MWLDFFSKKKTLKRGYTFDIRTDRYNCAINYFTNWLNEKAYTNYDNKLIEEVADALDEDMRALPYESTYGYGIHSLEITLKKNDNEYELSYTTDDVDAIIKEYLIDNSIIAE